MQNARRADASIVIQRDSVLPVEKAVRSDMDVTSYRHPAGEDAAVIDAGFVPYDHFPIAVIESLLGNTSGGVGFQFFVINQSHVSSPKAMARAIGRPEANFFEQPPPRRPPHLARHARAIGGEHGRPSLKKR